MNINRQKHTGAQVLRLPMRNILEITLTYSSFIVKHDGMCSFNYVFWMFPFQPFTVLGNEIANLRQVCYVIVGTDYV